MKALRAGAWIASITAGSAVIYGYANHELPTWLFGTVIAWTALTAVWATLRAEAGNDNNENP